MKFAKLNNSNVNIIIIALVILILGVMYIGVLERERRDLARLQCAQITQNVEFVRDIYGDIISEHTFPSEDRYQACLAEKSIR